MADDNKIIAELIVTGIDKAKADFGIITQESDKVVTNVEQIGTASTQAFNESVKGTTSFKAQLKTLQTELIASTIQLKEMEQAGQAGTDGFKKLEKQIEELRKKAGNLKDAISDASDEIKRAGSDTAGLDKALRTVGTATAAFQVFEGAATLAGKGNEDLQKALVKLNAVMAITQGLQQIQNELTRNDSIFKGLAAKATAAYNLIVGESTGALKAFRIALAATGIGLAVVAIAALVENWDKLKKVIGLSTFDLEQFNKALEEREGFQKGLEKGYQRELAEMKLNGKTEEEITRKAIELAKKQYDDGVGYLNDLRNKRMEAYGDKKAIEEIDKEIAKQQDKNFAADMTRVQGEITLNNILARNKKQAEEDAKKAVAEAAKAAEDYKAALESARKIQTDTFNENNIERYTEALENLKKQIFAIASGDIELGLNPKKNPQIQYLLDEYERLKKLLESSQFQLNNLFPIDRQEKQNVKLEERAKLEERINEELRKRNQAEQQMADAAPTREQVVLKAVEKALTFYDAIQNTISQTTNLISNATQIRAEKELASLDNKRKRGIISEKQYERESAKVKNEAARKQRAADVANAFAMIPQAVLSAYISGYKISPIAAGILAGIAGAFATAQAALVAAAPLPKFRHGGSVAKRLGLIRGKTHEQGGVPIEVEGNEFVMSKRAVQKYGVDFMDSINNLKVSPVVTMAGKMEKAGKTDYKLYEHLATMGSYMKSDYRANEITNSILKEINYGIKNNRRTYV